MTELARPPRWEDSGWQPDDIASIWVLPMACPEDGDRYAVALLASKHENEQTTDDVLLTYLRGYQPMRYAQACMAQAFRARHEQAVWAQLTTVFGMDIDTAAPVLAALRHNRPEIRPADTFPLSFTPILGIADMRGKVNVSVHGVEIGQWTFEATIDHAHSVIDVHTVAPLDTAYYDLLRDPRYVGLDELRSRQVVIGLADLMDPDATGVLVTPPTPQ